MAALQSHYPLYRHDQRPNDVDTALLKDAEDRVFTRSIARWLYDLQEEGRPLFEGVRFNSRHGDELVVTVGSYRRLLALPAALARQTVTGARVNSGSLQVKFRIEQDPSPAPPRRAHEEESP